MSHVTGRKLANRDKQHDNNSEADETLMIDEDIKDDLPLSKAKRLYISQDKNQQIYKQNYYESEVEEVIDTDDNSAGKSNVSRPYLPDKSCKSCLSVRIQ